MSPQKNILITAGPTHEPIDPVRYLTNRSSGKMGYALADACLAAGYSVTLISGPTNLAAPKNCLFVSVSTACEMHRAVWQHFKKADLVFMVAAVADYRIKKISKMKIKKNQQNLSLALIRNPDILKQLGQHKKARQILVGFAAETHQGVSYARKKLREKNLDWIALNVISGRNTGFGSNVNEVTLISSDGKKILIPRQPKEAVARQMLKAITNIDVDQQRKFDFKRFKIISFFAQKSLSSLSPFKNLSISLLR